MSNAQGSHRAARGGHRAAGTAEPPPYEPQTGPGATVPWFAPYEPSAPYEPYGVQDAYDPLPLCEQPVYGEAAYGQPLYGQPAYGQPAYGRSSYGQPVREAPAPAPHELPTLPVLPVPEQPASPQADAPNRALHEESRYEDGPRGEDPAQEPAETGYEVPEVRYPPEVPGPPEARQLPEDPYPEGPYAPRAAEEPGPVSGVDPTARTVVRTIPVPVPEPGFWAGDPAEVHPEFDRPRPAGAAENLRKLVPRALIVAFLAGGTTAFIADDKAVTLSVDGVTRTLHTFADDVDELLADQGLVVGAHDIVAPGPGAALSRGDQVVIRHGRPLLLTLDGERRRVWTTAGTVDGALRQLGVRAEGAFLSVSRSSAISRHGLVLDVRTERALTFMADGREHTIRTNAATVAAALAQAGITLRGEDTTSVPQDSFPRDGQTISVMRITAGEEVHDEAIPFTTERTGDASLFKGTEVVVRQGEPGTRRITYAVRSVNGVQQRPRKIRDEVLRRPVTQWIKVGTKPMPDSVDGADGLNWDGLAACESGGRAGAVDPSGNYGGLYQFDVGTWQALGGSGRPQEAPAAEQTFRAKKLYVQRGASPWPHCGRRLTG